MAKLYPPYLEGTLPAFCINTAQTYNDSNTKYYSRGDRVASASGQIYECKISEDQYQSYCEDELDHSLTNTEVWTELRGEKVGGGVLTIPFAHNQAVSKADIVNGGIVVKVKTVQNDILLADFSSTDEATGAQGDFLNSGEISFKIENFNIGKRWLDISVGQFYKIQLAYVDNNGVVGYYSTVGVVKCTSTPKVFIEGFDAEGVNNNKTEFVGVYEQVAGGDVSEKVYSSKFVITDLDGNIIESTGDVLHNIENNPNSHSSTDTMKFSRELDYGKIYKIKYIVTTTNGCVIESPTYLLTQQKSLSMELKGNLLAELNYDEGYIDVKLESYFDENGIEEVGNGTFILAREDSAEPGIWNELYRFALRYESPARTLFRDFTIEQGKTYTYSLQQYNKNHIYSDRKKSNEIYADFEDMFLFDGEHQLKIRFNPQVTSFKTQLSETRSETIGSKYPFFFRNAKVGYKTFPISGLISMLEDDNEFFVTHKEILRENFDRERHDAELDKKTNKITRKDTDLESANMRSERMFKLKVLDWINNGKVKLFRSPAEGNYLVRLMDSSLAPENALGRMIHNLNTTAYECAECTHMNMVKYDIVYSADVENAYVSTWYENNIGGYNFTKDVLNGEASVNLLTEDSDISGVSTTRIRLQDFTPGTQIKLVFDPSGNYNKAKSEIITIGVTGAYFADEVEPVYGIYVLNDSPEYTSYIEMKNYLETREKKIKEALGTKDYEKFKEFVNFIKDVYKKLTTKSNDSLWTVVTPSEDNNDGIWTEDGWFKKLKITDNAEKEFNALKEKWFTLFLNKLEQAIDQAESDSEQWKLDSREWIDQIKTYKANPQYNMDEALFNILFGFWANGMDEVSNLNGKKKSSVVPYTDTQLNDILLNSFMLAAEKLIKEEIGETWKDNYYDSTNWKQSWAMSWGIPEDTSTLDWNDWKENGWDKTFEQLPEHWYYENVYFDGSKDDWGEYLEKRKGLIGSEEWYVNYKKWEAWQNYLRGVLENYYTDLKQLSSYNKLVEDVYKDLYNKLGTVQEINELLTSYPNEIDRWYKMFQTVSLPENCGVLTSQNGIISYQYSIPVRNEFDSISQVTANVGSYSQIVGPAVNLVTYALSPDKGVTKNIREEMTKICMSNYHKRPVEFLYYAGEGNYATDQTAIFGAYKAGEEADGYRNINSSVPNLYWTNEFDLVGENLFDERECMNKSPFSLYVVRNPIIRGENYYSHIGHKITDAIKAYWEDLNGSGKYEEGEDISGNIYNDTTHDAHSDSHLFEKYYIDSILKMQSPEELLTQYSILWKLIQQQLDQIDANYYSGQIATNEERLYKKRQVMEIWEAQDPLYVIDPMNNRIYCVGKDFVYNPTLVYNGKQIDLREIEYYSLDNLDVNDVKELSIGNGVYCELYYQQITKTYELENLDKSVMGAKSSWQLVKKDLDKYWYYKDFVREYDGIYLTEDFHNSVNAENSRLEQQLYTTYITLLDRANKKWIRRDEDWEEAS